MEFAAKRGSFQHAHGPGNVDVCRHLDVATMEKQNGHASAVGGLRNWESGLRRGLVSGKELAETFLLLDRKSR